MSKIEKNTVVSVTYSILNEQEEVMEQSDLPVDYIHGTGGPLFEKIEQALDGKGVGDTVDVILEPEDAFGPHLPELTFTDNINNVPPEFRFVGAKPAFENDQGDTKEFVVTKIEDGKLTVDGNHPYAGKTIHFNVTVVALRPATPIELTNGVAQPTPGQPMQ